MPFACPLKTLFRSLGAAEDMLKQYGRGGNIKKVVILFAAKPWDCGTSWYVAKLRATQTNRSFSGCSLTDEAFSNDDSQTLFRSFYGS